MASPPIPDVIGPYRISTLIGVGGMGAVYRGTNEMTGEEAAVKTVRAPTRALFESLRQEIELLSRTRHARIVRVLDYDLAGGDPWYAMEFVPGETLGSYIRYLWLVPSAGEDSDTPPQGRRSVANGRLSEVLALFRKLCEPLVFLHREGIVHCDLKPSNILMRQDGDPVVMDFGLVTDARGAIDRESLSFVAGPRGTLAYVAPEVLKGQVPDPRADLYALGCMLYETVTGRPPFTGSRQDVIEAHLHAMPPAASALVHGVPPPLDALLARLLAKEVRTRLGDAAHVERDLAAITGSRPTSAASRAMFFRPHLVGRNGDLERVERCLQSLDERRGAIVLVGGESGIGKTFFASEAARRAVARGTKVIVGECEPPAPLAAGSLEMATSALSPLRRYFEFLRDCAREGGAEVLDSLLGRALPALAPYSPALASLRDQTDVPELSKLPQDAGRERLLGALAETLTAATKQVPLMLVLDDLQWADELTLALFETLRGTYLNRLPLLILATYRTEAETHTVAALTERSDVVTLRLERLGQNEVASMIRDMVGIDEPDPALVEFVYSHAEGVPFFTAEYLRSLASEGLLTHADGTWRLPEQPSAMRGARLSVPFPVRLAELIQRRIGELHSVTLTALQAGAALGREFDVAVVAAMLDVSCERAHEQLQDARNRQIVMGTGTGETLRFAHDKFREAIYAELPEAQRRALHGAAARALEMRYRDGGEFEYVYGDIARHFRLAGDTAAALDYLEKAGERALQISADAEALQFLREAIELEKNSTVRASALRRATWQRGVAEALHGLGRVAESAPPLASAAELLGHPIPRTPAALGIGIAEHLARRLLPSALGKTTAEEARLALEMGRVLERVLRISYYTGQNLQLLYACVASLTFCERAGPSPELATAYSNAGATAGILPAHRLARSYFTRALALLPKDTAPVEESQLCMLEASYYMGVGHRTRAIRIAEEGIAAAQRIGFHRREDECTAIRSGIDMHAGHHGAIETRSARIEASARRRGDAQMTSWALLQRLEGLVMRGMYEAACDCVESLWPLLPQSERAEKIWILGFAAYAHYRLGNERLACQYADDATTLVEQGPLMQSYTANALDRLAELRMLHWRKRGYTRARPHKGLESAATKACRALRGIARVFPFAVPGAMLQSGLLHWARGEKTKAVKCWTTGAQEAQRMSLTYHEARSLFALGCAHTGEAGAASRRQALELLASLEIDPSTLVYDSLVIDAAGRPRWYTRGTNSSGASSRTSH